MFLLFSRNKAACLRYETSGCGCDIVLIRLINALNQYTACLIFAHESTLLINVMIGDNLFADALYELCENESVQHDTDSFPAFCLISGNNVSREGGFVNSTCG